MCVPNYWLRCLLFHLLLNSVTVSIFLCHRLWIHDIFFLCYFQPMLLNWTINQHIIFCFSFLICESVMKWSWSSQVLLSSQTNYCVLLNLFQLWLINSDSDETEKKGPTATYQNSLSYHGSAVNTLRFSPSGKDAPILFKFVHFVKMWMVSIMCIAILSNYATTKYI